MNRKVYISDDEHEKCCKVVDAFAELYENTEDDIVVLDGGRYGFIKLQYYNYPYGFNTAITFTDSRALFDDLWEDWLNMQLFGLAKDSTMIEMDYEDIFKCMPKQTQDMLMEKRFYFAEKTGIADILG
ncbi:MAG: hypothetical protein K2M91_15030 [Lachnospiraceae bacterium]|nr:hypothetical protein [Lachnospiraceae bacterium]